MSAVQLTNSQKQLLTSLVDLSRHEETPITGSEIAETIDRNPGTIRNQMQSLKALQLVEGIPGPKGGYKPTTDAYDTLDRQQLDDPVDVPVKQEGKPVTEVNVAEIDLSTVHDPDKCRAKIQLEGSVHKFDQGDQVTIGPTPNTNLTLTGSVASTIPTENTLILDIQTIQTPTQQPAD